MILMNLSKIKKAFGTDVLFEDVSFSVDEHDKIGFVGANGVGKTTLFRLMLGEMAADGGEIFKNSRTNIGYMEQQTHLTSSRTVYDELLTVFSHLEEMERELSEITCRIEAGDADTDALIRRHEALSERYSAEGGLTYKNVAKASLMGLGFSERELFLDFSSLSGGQKTRVHLCKILLGQANLLFLDEPTNHLDIASVEWLENFLRDYRGAFIIISHDRYFLDRVANKIYELEHGRLTVYNGNYTEYQRQKEENRKAKERRYENTKSEIERLEGIVEQQRRWNREKNIKTAESKLKAIERLEKTLEKPDEQLSGIRFAFKPQAVGGNDVLSVRDLSMRFGEKKIFSHAEFHLSRAERVFLLGPNGCGKTTLFKLILGEHTAVGGEIKLGANIKIGYYDQTQEHLDYTKTVFDEVADSYPKMTQTEIRSALAAFLFRADDVFKLISELSGGERARVLLLKLMLSGANLLLLDEPTNHLDIASREALEEALLSYPGTFLVVSHDRYFINKLAQRVIYLTQDKMENYPGDYDYFLEKKKAPKGIEAKSANQAGAGKEEYLLKKKQDAEERKRKNRLAKVEEEIALLEAEIKEKSTLLATEEYATDYVKAAELTKEITEKEDKLSQLYEEWESLSE
ncbi:MAG: ABC-F type ribosomal protection protein [Clostridia bacterium]|nr:ABC-F type ribosomal protection protein [Clostridia bacterium]